jgi:flagellar hook-length control protein FliK
MSNSSFDNLYVTPGALAPGNAAIAQTSSDSRDFDDALQRAYKPEDASDQVDPPQRDDSRDITGGPSTSDFGSSGSTMVRSSRRDSDSSTDSSRSQDRTSANDGARRSTNSNQSTTSQPKAKPRPAAHEKTKPADKPAAPAKKPPPTKSADRDTKPTAADAAASSDANEVAKVVPTETEAAGETAQATADAQKNSLPNQLPVDATAVAGADSATSANGTPAQATAQAAAKTVEIVTQTKVNLPSAAAVKSTGANAKIGPQEGSLQAADANQSETAASQANLAGQALNAQQQQTVSPGASANSPSNATGPARPGKSTAKPILSPADGTDGSTNATMQIDPTITLPDQSIPLTPVGSTSSAPVAATPDSTKKTDDDSSESHDAAPNQPGSLSTNNFADALREPAANVPGQVSTAGAAEKTASASESRGTSQVDQARFVQRVANAFRSADDDGGQIRLRLSPPELGSLKLEVTMRNGVMTARMETETNTARTLLLDNLPALRQRLADQNIKIERFDVDLKQDGRGDGSPKPPPDFSDSRQNLPRSPSTGRVATTSRRTTEQQVATAPSGGVASNSRINIVI